MKVRAKLNPRERIFWWGWWNLSIGAIRIFLFHKQTYQEIFIWFYPLSRHQRKNFSPVHLRCKIVCLKACMSTCLYTPTHTAICTCTCANSMHAFAAKVVLSFYLAGYGKLWTSFNLYRIYSSDEQQWTIYRNAAVKYLRAVWFCFAPVFFR